MTVDQFYAGLLRDSAVELSVLAAARERRGEVQATLERRVGAKISGTDSFGAGALAQGTQIHPLNDVDVVARVPYVLPAWIDNPSQAMSDVQSWIEGDIAGAFSVTTHAIRIRFPDEEFTADVVVGRAQSQGILLPHCPSDEPHRWIASDPLGHRHLVGRRNKEFESFGRSVFTKQLRILKCWNLQEQLRDEEERKPVSSFHLTALALEILKRPAKFSAWTPTFFESAARLVTTPLRDPSGVGDPIEARDPVRAAARLAEAAEKTRAAISAPPDEMQRLLTEVFGSPGLRRSLVGRGSVSVGATGALVAGSAAGTRSIRSVRSHGNAH